MISELNTLLQPMMEVLSGLQDEAMSLRQNISQTASLMDARTARIAAAAIKYVEARHREEVDPCQSHGVADDHKCRCHDAMKFYNALEDAVLGE